MTSILKVSEIQDPTNSNTALTIHANGLVTKPNLPAFFVRPNAVQSNIPVSSATTIVFDQEYYDQGAYFSSNTFTAPVNGFYHFSCYIRLENVDTAASYYLLMWQLGGIQRQGHLFSPLLSSDPSYWAMNSSLTYYLTAGQTAYLQIWQNGGSQQTDIGTDSWFSGHLVG